MPADDAAIWRVLEPIIRAGETYVLPRDMSKEGALAYWRSPGHEVFVAEDEGAIVGTYYLRANQPGGGAHVANCGYMTAPDAGGRPLSPPIGGHPLAQARRPGLPPQPVNFVVARQQRPGPVLHRPRLSTLGRAPR